MHKKIAWNSKRNVDESGIRTHANYLTTILNSGEPERSALDRSAISPVIVERSKLNYNKVSEKFSRQDPMEEEALSCFSPSGAHY